MIVTVDRYIYNFQPGAVAYVARANDAVLLTTRLDLGRHRRADATRERIEESARALTFDLATRLWWREWTPTEAEGRNRHECARWLGIAGLAERELKASAANQQRYCGAFFNLIEVDICEATP
jgi:hypothetical protein